jgi:HTH-type transcriptional regulator, sugar sensing transcriptional regulator
MTTMIVNNMDNFELSQILIQFGFSNKESLVYLTVLKLGSAPASLIAKKAEMPRTTAKFICEQLAAKGLFSESMRANSSIYIAEPPEKFLMIFDKKESELEKKRNEFNKIFPVLNALSNPQILLPKIKFYTLIDDIGYIFKEILSSVKNGQSLDSIVNILKQTHASNFLQKAINKFINQRVERNIFSRVLAINSKEALQLKKDDKRYLRETKIIDKTIPEMQAAEIFLAGNKIFTISLDDVSFFAYIVENEIVAKIHRVLFDTSWKSIMSSNKQ